MKKLILLLTATSVFAALPPLAQGIREVQSLLGDHRFYESLGSGEILKDIIQTDSGYLILTENYAMKVDVKYIESSKVIGPVQFVFDFNLPVSLKTGELKNL